MHFFFLKKDNYILHSKKIEVISLEYKIKLYKPNSYIFTIDSFFMYTCLYILYLFYRCEKLRNYICTRTHAIHVETFA